MSDRCERCGSYRYDIDSCQHKPSPYEKIKELKTETLQLKLYIEQLKEDRGRAIAQAREFMKTKATS